MSDLDPAGLEAAAKALEKSSGDSEECCPEIGGCGGTHTDCWYRSRAADTIRAYSAAVLPPDESEAAKAVAAGRAAATPGPPVESWSCCGQTFTGTTDFISGVRAAHVCPPEDVPDAETAYAMGKAAAASPDERLREALTFYADAGNYVGGEVGWWGDHRGEPVWCMDFGSIARNALAVLAADREAPDEETHDGDR